MNISSLFNRIAPAWCCLLENGPSGYNVNMLQLSGMIISRPVLSLRTGTQVATALAPIINPHNLKIEGFYCKSVGRKQTILVVQDVRDVLPQGIVVNDEDVLTEAHDLVRLKNVLSLGFELIGKPVETASKQRLGKVNDYATETDSMIIKKLYVSQPIYKNFTGGNLGIDRTQIVEINDKKIVVNDLNAKVPAHAAAAA
jgi:uncharacterized protein YrrD